MCDTSTDGRLLRYWFDVYGCEFDIRELQKQMNWAWPIDNDCDVKELIREALDDALRTIKVRELYEKYGQNPMRCLDEMTPEEQVFMTDVINDLLTKGPPDYRERAEAQLAEIFSEDVAAQFVGRHDAPRHEHD